MGKGTGLGLAMVYGIIKDHDGHIHCESEPERGSTFEIFLPIAKEDKAVSAMEQGRAVIEDFSHFSGSGTILLAEDNDIVREFMAKILRSAGYSVIEAVNGVDAMQKFQNHDSKIDLLLTDILMPKMNGNELHKVIRAIAPQIKTIFTTGYTPEEIATSLSVDSQTDIIYKPIQPLELLKKLRTVLVD